MSRAVINFNKIHENASYSSSTARYVGDKFGCIAITELRRQAHQFPSSKTFQRFPSYKYSENKSK